MAIATFRLGHSEPLLSNKQAYSQSSSTNFSSLTAGLYKLVAGLERHPKLRKRFRDMKVVSTDALRRVTTTSRNGAALKRFERSEAVERLERLERIDPRDSVFPVRPPGDVGTQLRS